MRLRLGAWIPSPRIEDTPHVLPRSCLFFERAPYTSNDCEGALLPHIPHYLPVPHAKPDTPTPPTTNKCATVCRTTALEGRPCCFCCFCASMKTSASEQAYEFIDGACFAAVSYKPPMLVTPSRAFACAFIQTNAEFKSTKPAASIIQDFDLNGGWLTWRVEKKVEYGAVVSQPLRARSFSKTTLGCRKGLDHK